MHLLWLVLAASPCIAGGWPGGWSGGGGGGGGWPANNNVASPTVDPVTVTAVETMTATPTWGHWHANWTHGNWKKWREERQKQEADAAAAAAASAAQQASNQQAQSMATIVGATVGAVALVAISAAVAMLLIKRSRKKKKEALRGKRDTMDMLAEKLAESSNRDRVLEALNRREFVDGEYESSLAASSRHGGSHATGTTNPTYIVLNVPAPAQLPFDVPPVPPVPPSPVYSDVFTDSGQDTWDAEAPRPYIPPPPASQPAGVVGSLHETQSPSFEDAPPLESRPSMSSTGRRFIQEQRGNWA